MSGFFGVVSRYARPALAEQRENRLTQVFAGVLSNAPGLALDLSRSWLTTSPNDGLAPQRTPGAAAALREDRLDLRSVRTQRPTYGGGYVDLELQFGRPGTSPAEDVVIWVEVKHGASPHEHQLENYLEDIARLPARCGAVVLLAPRGSYPFDKPAPPPEDVWQCTWQQTAARCARWATRADGVPRFLVDELLDYLQEEKLMDLEVMTPVHLVALAEYKRVLDGIRTICEVVSGYVDREWNTPYLYKEVRGKAEFGVGYWEMRATLDELCHGF